MGNRKECLHDYAGFPGRNEARAERPGALDAEQHVSIAGAFSFYSPVIE